MAIYKKINKQTGAEELRYIVFDGDENNLYHDIVNFHFIDCDLYDYNYIVHVKSFNGTVYVAIAYDDDNILDFCTHIRVGEALMPFYFVCACDGETCEGCDYEEIRWDKSRTYTPADLEALYPSDKYDTVEVGDVRDC